MAFVKKAIATIKYETACMILMIVPAFFLVFHCLIIGGFLPKTIVWGGRLTEATLLPLEILALLLNLSLMVTGAVAANRITASFAVKFVHWIKWFLFYFVVVNTFAGLFSTTTFEVLLTPVTALYALCLYRIISFPDGLEAVARRSVPASGGSDRG